ncbi:Ca2+-dependent lipid-binding protein CLB1/vesicle protein vp115/Granuphilin A, contains C2 domain [Trachipleistophora hominis]|uniref:Ca2+-dependent lipid-binding protein CLB1/vesicle protein vp115/Granuphilin A, contains C2 domain n=1 Tax=Trachipleistophora hominis TaxID=72359 RepID=L7JWK7_TRAHO|nr:Ca2+-dependent lipid-binding protein CLB1/vesicle protein vp115/Granuphilin A, contains C2 domain [Trachipleistophora hominis]
MDGSPPLKKMEEAVKIRNLKNKEESALGAHHKKSMAEMDKETMKKLEEINKSKEDEENRINEMYEQSRVEFVNSLDMDVPKTIFLRVPGVLFACALLSYLIGRLRLNFSLLVLVLYGMYFLFSRNVRKFKKSMAALVFRDERRRKVCELESVEWINFAVERVWKIIEAEVSKEVFRVVNPILAEKCPSFLSQLALSEFTLGSLPPTLKGISFDSRAAQNVVSFDAEVFFVPLETGRGAAMMCLSDSMNWNSRIVLTARLGLSVKGKGLDIPIMVRNLSFAGRMRIILTLAKSLVTPLVSVELCFLSAPQIDFDLCPLKSIDLMNMPGLSTFIHTLIDSNLQKMLVDPNSLTIDLRKKGKEEAAPQGVVLLHLYSLDNTSDMSCYAEIDVDGRRLYKTERREGTRIVYNEYFYVVVHNRDDTVNVTFTSTAVNVSHKYGTAGVCLKKLRSIGSVLQDIKIWRKGTIRAVLETDIKYYPVVHGPVVPNQHMAAQTVVIIGVQQIENLQGQRKPRNRLYNTFCQVMVCEALAGKLQRKDESLTDFLAGALKGAGSLSKNIAGVLTKNLKSGFNTLTGTSEAEDTEALQGASHTTMFVGRTHRVMETRSPFFDEKFEVFCRNIQKDVLYLTVVDQQESENEVIGTVDVPLRDVYDGTEAFFKIKGAQQGRVKLSFAMHYITPFISPFKRYVHAVRIRLVQLVTTYDEGVFYAVVKNRRESFFIDNFCYGDLPINREVIVPAEEDDRLRIFLFRENFNESDFIGEGTVDVVNSTQEVEVVERGEVEGTVTVSVEVEELRGVGCVRCARSGSGGVTGRHSGEEHLDEERSDKHANQNEIEERLEDAVAAGRITDENVLGMEGLAGPVAGPNDEISEKECPVHRDCLSEINPHESEVSSTYLRRDVVTPKPEISDSTYHAVQVAFRHFEGVRENFFIEFVCDDEVIKKSGLIKAREGTADQDAQGMLGVYEHCHLNSNCEVFTLLCGESVVRAKLRTAAFGKTRVIGECVVPKRCMEEKVALGGDAHVLMTVCAQRACFKWRDYFKVGYLEVRILGATKVRGVEKNSMSDPYVKAYLNNTKVYKTKTIQNTVNPSFNESFFCKVNIMTDVIRFDVIDWNRIETDQLISFVEIPLYFVVEGFTEVRLQLIDALKMRKDGSYLHLGFVFNKTYKGGENAKKIAASTFI